MRWDGKSSPTGRAAILAARGVTETPAVALPKTEQELKAATTQALKRGDYDAVIALQEQLLALDNLSARADQFARIMLGNAYLVQSKPAEARKVLKEFAAKDYPDLSPEQAKSLFKMKQSAQFTVAMTYVLEDDKVKAREVLQNLLAAGETDSVLIEAAKKLLETIKPEQGKTE